MDMHDWVAALPAVNACLNGLATLLLVTGYTLIRRGRRNAHMRAMLSAFATSVAFLVCYLVYHTALRHYTGEAGKRFEGTGSIRAAYYLILVTHVVLPGVSRVMGYLPARWLGQGEDLPAGVAREWASWCRHPGYIVGALGAEEAYARFTAPIRAYAIGDDAYAPPAAVE